MKAAYKHQALCEWTGVLRPLSPTPRTKEQAIADILPSVLTSMGLDQRVRQQMIIQVWPQIVGADIARHAHPTALRRGVLIISVNHSTWLDVLAREHKQEILQRFSQALPQISLKDIQFRIG